MIAALADSKPVVALPLTLRKSHSVTTVVALVSDPPSAHNAALAMHHVCNN